MKGGQGVLLAGVTSKDGWEARTCGHSPRLFEILDLAINSWAIELVHCNGAEGREG